MNLSAANLKDALWDTLQAVKNEKIHFQQADAVAAQAREITRVVKVQIQIATEAKRPVPADVISFSEQTTTKRSRR